MLAQGEALVANIVDVKVPDIGDYKDVPIIEILVKPGDVVKADASLVTLESDKATMDVPAPKAGTVREIIAKIGDKVSMGSPILTLEDSAAPAAKSEASAPKAAAPAPKTEEPAPSGGAVEVKVPDIGDFHDVLPTRTTSMIRTTMTA